MKHNGSVVLEGFYFVQVPGRRWHLHERLKVSINHSNKLLTSGLFFQKTRCHYKEEINAYRNEHSLEAFSLFGIIYNEAIGISYLNQIYLSYPKWAEMWK
jgi:hypothetical protein